MHFAVAKREPSGAVDHLGSTYQLLPGMQYKSHPSYPPTHASREVAIQQECRATVTHHDQNVKCPLRSLSSLWDILRRPELHIYFPGGFSPPPVGWRQGNIPLKIVNNTKPVRHPVNDQYFVVSDGVIGLCTRVVRPPHNSGKNSLKSLPNCVRFKSVGFARLN